VVFVKHRANIRRLFAGTENRISWGAPTRKMVHVLALGLWFGSAVFFTFIVAPSLFGTFEALGESEKRPAWFPQAEHFAKQDANINGPKEQGTRLAGDAVGPIFPIYFGLQLLCGLVSAWTALAWARENPGVRMHKWRTIVLIVAFLSVLAAWPLERHVTELREPRNRAIDAYLTEKSSDLQLKMTNARSEFGRWHL